MYISENVINDVVDIIVNTRDFCGNEKEAAIDRFFDHGIVGCYAARGSKVANYRANARWNDRKKAAGVNPKYIF